MYLSYGPIFEDIGLRLYANACVWIQSRTVRDRILKSNMWNKHEKLVDPYFFFSFFLFVGLVIAELCPFFDFCIVNLWNLVNKIWAPSSEFVSSNIPSWQISTAHAQPFRGAMDLAFCLKVPLDSLLVWASGEGSGETARNRRLARTFAARICKHMVGGIVFYKHIFLVKSSYTST